MKVKRRRLSSTGHRYRNLTGKFDATGLLAVEGFHQGNVARI